MINDGSVVPGEKRFLCIYTSTLNLTRMEYYEEKRCLTDALDIVVVVALLLIILVGFVVYWAMSRRVKKLRRRQSVGSA